MPEPSKYYDVVKLVYERSLKARDSDAVLIARVLAILIGPEKWEKITLRDYLLRVYHNDLPSMDTITRAGRKVRELYPALRGSKAAQERREEEKRVTMDDLNYPTPHPTEDNQLPLPI